MEKIRGDRMDELKISVLLSLNIILPVLVSSTVGNTEITFLLVVNV